MERSLAVPNDHDLDESLSDRELEQRFGITLEQIEQWESEIAAGKIPGEPGGPILFRQTSAEV